MGPDECTVAEVHWKLGASDPGTWGPTGLLPGFPGAEDYPPQPMMDQIRTVLDNYTSHGGTYQEVAVEGSGHVPFISHPDDFNRVFHAHLEQFHKGQDHA